MKPLPVIIESIYIIHYIIQYTTLNIIEALARVRLLEEVRQPRHVPEDPEPVGAVVVDLMGN